MSGIHSIEGISAFERQPTKSATTESVVKPPPNEVSKDSGDRTPAFDFASLSEEDKKKLEEELKKLNESLVPYDKQIRFRYNEEAKQTYVEVIDSETNQVVTSLPPEFLIDLSIKMKEMIGMFMDKKL